MCSANKEACLSEVLSPPVGDNDRVWSLRFYREFNDWELAASYSLLHFIQTRIPRGEGSDRLFWCLNGSGKFDVQSFYNKIRNVTLPTFPWKGIWKVKVPGRVAFFMWTTAHVRSLLWITLCSVAVFWQIIVVCVVVMRNLWTTC